MYIICREVSETRCVYTAGIFWKKGERVTGLSPGKPCDARNAERGADAVIAVIRSKFREFIPDSPPVVVLQHQLEAAANFPTGSRQAKLRQDKSVRRVVDTGVQFQQFHAGYRLHPAIGHAAVNRQG